MDLIAKRFEARYLETEGKPREALALCREIIEHFEREPAQEDLLPVYLKASDLTIKLGDRAEGVAILIRAAEYFADHGLVAPVTDLCHRLPRVDPSLTRLHLRFARRMLEHQHVAPACDLLRDLAVRRKKAALRQTLERMATWPEPIVRGQLLEFLDRAEAKQRSGERPAIEVPAEPAPPEAAPPPAPSPSPPAPPPPVSAAEEEPVAHLEIPVPPPDRRPSPVPPPSPLPVAPPDVEFVESTAREPRVSPPPSRIPDRPMVPVPRRRRRRHVLRWAGLAAAVVLVAAGVWLGRRFLRSQPEVAAPIPAAPGATTTASSTPGPAAPTDTGVAAPAGADSAVAAAGGPAVESQPTSPPSGAAPPLVQRDTVARVAGPPPPLPAAAVGVVAPSAPLTDPVREVPDTARRIQPDTARPAPPEPEPAPVDPRPVVLRVDYAVVVVGGLEAVRVGIEGEGSSRRVVVLQLLPNGDTLELRAADLGAGSVGVGDGRILVSRHPSGGAMGTARVGQFLVTARAAIAPDSLEPLLRRLVEVRPE